MTIDWFLISLFSVIFLLIGIIIGLKMSINMVVQEQFTQGFKAGGDYVMEMEQKRKIKGGVKDDPAGRLHKS